MNNSVIVIKVLFFGATADEAGKRGLELSLNDESSAQVALDKILDQFPKLKNHRLLYAVNQEYVSHEHKLSDGDELAVFTAVSGG